MIRPSDRIGAVPVLHMRRSGLAEVRRDTFDLGRLARDLTSSTGRWASASAIVSATCERTPNASLHLWRQCRHQVLQFCIFQLVCLDGGFSPAQGRLLCSEHSEKSGRDRGCLDSKLSTQTSYNSSRCDSTRPRVLPAPFNVLNATNIAKLRGTN